MDESLWFKFFFQNVSKNIRWFPFFLNFQFISYVKLLSSEPIYKERIQLYLGCRDLKSNSLKSSEILFDLVPIPSKEYEHYFSSP